MTSDMPQKLADQEDSGSNQYLSENPLLAHIEHYENGVINIFNLTEFDLQIGGVSLDGALIDSRFLGFEIPPLNRRTLEPVSLRTAAFGRLDDRVSVFFYSSAGESESTNKFSLLSRSSVERYSPGELSLKETISFRGDRHMTIKPGVTIISKPIEFEGEVEIHPGAQLYFCDDCELIVKGSLSLLGTEGSPISMLGIKDGWRGVYVIGDGTAVSNWSHVTVSSTRPTAASGYRRSGGVTFFNSDIHMNNIAIAGSMFDDAVNIVQSRYRISEMKVEEAKSDGIDFDYSNGVLTSVYLAAIGGDGLDLSGGDSVVNESSFRDIGDKAISVGEEALAYIADVHVADASIGVASKDGSEVTLRGMQCENGVVNPLATFSKKSIYGSPAKIAASSISLSCTQGLMRQIGSRMELNGREVPAMRFDTQSLYGE